MPHSSQPHRDPGSPASGLCSLGWGGGYRAKRDRILFLATALFAAAILAPTLTAQTAASLETLRKDFLNPPNEARPMVRWWWFGPAVVKPEILRELQQMKADGIQGAELAFVYPEVLDDPAKGLKNLSFLSPEMLDDVNYAQTEGRKLGLRIDVTLCSGWPYGGPATTLVEAATRLRTAEVSVPANSNSVTAPTLEEGETFISAADVDSTRSVETAPPPLPDKAVAATPVHPRPPSTPPPPSPAPSPTPPQPSQRPTSPAPPSSLSRATPSRPSSEPRSMPKATSSIPSPTTL